MSSIRQTTDHTDGIDDGKVGGKAVGGGLAKPPRRAVQAGGELEMLGRFRRAQQFMTEAEEKHTDVPARGTPSLAQDAAIAAIDPRSGKLWNNARFVVPTALLVELAHEGRLDVSGTGKKARVSLRDSTPLGNKELDEALLTVGGGVYGQKVTTLITAVPQTRHLVARLVEDGVLGEESHRRLGMFTARRLEPVSRASHDELTARLRSALLGESVPDEWTALLVSVLVGVHLKVFVPKARVNEAYGRLDEVRQRIGEGERAIVAAAQVALSNRGGYSSGV